MHPDLRTAGSLPSLDMPHHLKAHEWCRFREGVTGVTIRDQGTGSALTRVHCGIDEEVCIAGEIDLGSRLTIQLPVQGSSGQGIMAEAIGPDIPREQDGIYWGYSTRQASSLGAVFTECEFDDGYDFSIGTSERGTSVDKLTDTQDDTFLPPTWQHLLVVIGGVAGLEAALDADDDLRSAGISNVQQIFDRWVNVLPGQGSRTIRAEEALWISLSRLRSCIDGRAAAAE